MSNAQGAGEPKKPWWQLTKTARQSFLLAAVWLVVGIANLVAIVSEPSDVNWSHWLLLAIGGLNGTAYLVNEIALRGRAQRA